MADRPLTTLDRQSRPAQSVGQLVDERVDLDRPTVTEQIHEALDQHLGTERRGGGRFRAFQARRKKVVEHLQAQIDRHGEEIIVW